MRKLHNAKLCVTYKRLRCHKLTYVPGRHGAHMDGGVWQRVYRTWEPAGSPREDFDWAAAHTHRAARMASIKSGFMAPSRSISVVAEPTTEMTRAGTSRCDTGRHVSV